MCRKRAVHALDGGDFDDVPPRTLEFRHIHPNLTKADLHVIDLRIGPLFEETDFNFQRLNSSTYV